MIRVVVADDHPIVLNGLRSALDEASGIEVVGSAEDFPSLRRVVDDTECDVVVMDVRMPGGTALDELARLRARYPDRAVLVLSAYPVEQLATRFLRAGAAGFVPKDSDPEEVVEAVRTVSAGRTWADPRLTDILAGELRGDHAGEPHERLSDREFQVLCLLGSGQSVTEVAERLHLSPKTISTYRRRLMDKMNLASTAELTRYVVERDLA